MRQLFRAGKQSRIKRTIAQEVVERAMHLIGSRLGHDINLSGAGAAELSGVSSGLNLKLTYHIRPQADDISIETRVCINCSIEQVIVSVGAASADAKGRRLARTPVEGI